MIEMKEITVKSMIEQLDFVIDLLDAIERNDEYKPKTFCKYGIGELNSMKDYLEICIMKEM